MKRYALLVGVEDYRDKMISRLNYARTDATALAGRLTDRCGFDHVRVLVDESGENEPLLVNIVTALRDMAAELRPDDLFLFFFAGHGVEKDGHGYLLARDSLQAFPEHGSLSLELLRKTFEHLSASKRIILLDACRNSPNAGRSDSANCMGDVISRDIVAAARAKLTGGTTTALLSACRSGQRAYEWPRKKHGVFTHYLLQGLDNAAWEGDKLEFQALAEYASREVRNWSAQSVGVHAAQEPWFEQFGDACSLIMAGGSSPNGPRQSSLPDVAMLSDQSLRGSKTQSQVTVRKWALVGGILLVIAATGVWAVGYWNGRKETNDIRSARSLVAAGKYEDAITFLEAKEFSSARESIRKAIVVEAGDLRDRYEEQTLKDANLLAETRKYGEATVALEAKHFSPRREPERQALLAEVLTRRSVHEDQLLKEAASAISAGQFAQVAGMLQNLQFTATRDPERRRLLAEAARMCDLEAAQLALREGRPKDIDSLLAARYGDNDFVERVTGLRRQYGYGNLLVNSGNEEHLVDRKVPGWTIIAGDWQQRYEDPAAMSGKYYFYAGNSERAELRQDVNIAACLRQRPDGPRRIHFVGYFCVYQDKERLLVGRPTPDLAEITLLFLDSGGQTHKMLSTERMSPYQWERVEWWSDIPAGTQIVRICLLSWRRIGEHNDGYFDELSLTLEQ